VEAFPGVIIRLCRYRIGIRVRLDGKDKIVNLDPESMILEQDLQNPSLRDIARKSKLT